MANERTFTNDKGVIAEAGEYFPWKKDEGGGGGSVTVDAALSETSENPVQNKVIAEALTRKVSVSQGAANAGKFLIVGSDGNITPVTMTAWQGGSY